MNVYVRGLLAFLMGFLLGLILISTSGCEKMVAENRSLADKQANLHKMDCSRVTKFFMYRCENNEAICYISSEDGLQCKWKTRAIHVRGE